MKLKRLFIAFISAAILILTAVSLFSCKDGALKFTNDGTGNLTDIENGRYYIYCKGYLQAAAIKPNIYAKGDEGEKLYEVDGIDPSEWLSEDISKGIAFLFREESIEEPKFEDFETEKIHIIESELINAEVGLIDDKEDTDKIVNDFLYNNQTAYPDYITDYFSFYFESEKYAGIYYVLDYLVDEKNNAYLFDRWTGRCVSCSIKLFGGTGIDTYADIE